MRAYLRVIVAVIGLAAASSSAEAAKRLALVVGASQYTANNLKPLAGPPNDVRLMWQTLQRMGFNSDDITVLADAMGTGPDWPRANGLPTRDAILAAIRRLRSTATPDDFVVIYLAGHGTRMAEAIEGQEDDGYDEVYLALDAKVNATTRRLENGIIDDEFEAELYGTGGADGFAANVWLIFDTCHSGDMTRGATATRHADLADMGVAPEFLQPRGKTRSAGIPNALSKKSTALQAQGPKRNIVTFSAVAPTDLAIERAIPERKGVMHGVFTHLLTQVLAAEGARSVGTLTYSQIGDRLQAAYAAYDPTLPRPRFDGELKKALGSRHQPWTAKVQTEWVDLDVGNAQGVRVGSILSLHAGDGPALGYVRISEDGFLKSKAAAIEFRDVPITAVTALTGKNLAARPVEIVTFSLRVGLPPASTRDDASWVQTLRAALRTIEQRNAGQNGMPLTFVEAGKDTDVFLELADSGERVFLLPATGRTPAGTTDQRTWPNVPVDVRSSEQTANRVEVELAKLLRQRNLLEVAARLPVPAFAAGLAITLFVDKSDRRAETEACPEDKPFNAATAQVVDQIDGIGLTHCDRIYVKLRNTGARAIEVTCRYLDADGGIGWPAYRGADRACALRQRLQPNYVADASAPITIVTKCNATQPACKGSANYMAVGTERLLILALERDASDPAITFEDLDQPPVPRERAEREETRSSSPAKTPAEAFRALLARASDGGTRGASDLGAPEVLLRTFTFTVVPPG